jgi:hypothetical protein
MSPYASLNPFVSTSVGEKDLWNATVFPDVPEIHAASFNVLKATVDQVRIQHRSQVRFVRGAGGAGKSHLFARLRREYADRILYAYAPNPPLQPEALESFILSRFVSSLRHPARSTSGEEAPYSQLRMLAYTLLKPVVEQDLTLPELHVAWAKIALESRKELIHQAVLLLEGDHPMVPRSVLRCLLNVLREDKEHLAAQWLSGAAYLTDNELKYLNVPEPLSRAEAGTVIQLFGKLASQAGSPVVLVLDQLDLVTTAPQLDEMQRLLFSLIDQSENWVILIGLVAERFAAWDSALTQALRGRVGVPDTNAPLGFRLPVADMLPVAAEQKRALLMCRLESADLAAQRQKDGITSTIHPLLEEDITKLTAGGAIFSRHLLAAAAEVFAARAENPPTASKLPNDVVQKAVQPAKPPAPAAQVPVPPRPSPPPIPPATAGAPARATPPPPSVPGISKAAPMPPPPPAAVPTSSPATVPPVAARAIEDGKDTNGGAAAVAVIPEPDKPAAKPAKTPLAEKIDALLQQAIDAARTDQVSESAVDLGERARDLIELMVAPPVTVTEGDLRNSYENFDGADRWFEWGGGRLRIVSSNAMRGSFIAVLERLKEAAGDTLLLRHAVAPVSGQLTLELLNVFKGKNTFHHVPASETALLSAMGRMLAAQREGSYDQLPTEPAATKDHVLAALRSHPLIRGSRLWEMIQKVHAPKPPASVVVPPAPSVLSTIARPAPAAKPAATPSAPPPASTPPPPPSALPVARPITPGVVTKPVAKPVAQPPAPPVAKPAAAAPRPPMARQLPPPSQGNAA